MKSCSRIVTTPLILACWLSLTSCGSAGCLQATSQQDASDETSSNEAASSGTASDETEALETEAVETEAVEAASNETADDANNDTLPAVNSSETPVAAADTSPTETQLGISREQTLLASLTIFVLAMFVGFEVITKVPPTLHTPLMSGSNAISGITIVGAALMAGNGQSVWAMCFGFLAVIMATINVIGGFMVTDRMLAMFKKK